MGIKAQANNFSLAAGAIRLSLLSKTAISTGLLVACSTALSGELKFDVGIENTYVKQEVDATGNYADSSENIIITPYLGFTYTARDLEASLLAEHNHVRRSLDDADSTNNYTNFTYNTHYDIIRNLLYVNVRGSQQYNSLNNQTFSVDDFLLNSEDLTETNYHSGALVLNLPTGNYFGTSASLSYSSSSSKRESNNDSVTSGIFSNSDNETFGAQWSLNSGDDIRPISFYWDATAQLSKRNSLGDYKSNYISGSIGTIVYRDLSLNLLGSYETNEVEDTDLNAQGIDSKREFQSYGIGLRWQASTDRYIQVGFNKSKTTGDSLDNTSSVDEEDEYISLDTSWQFSPRTILSAAFYRRFFGDSANVMLSHNLRSWRSRVSYREDVNTNTQLSQISELGLFVCDNGAADLAECTLPDSIDLSNLDAGQIVVPFVETGFELNDNLILRKSLSIQSSITRRRTTVSIVGTHSKNENLEASRITETQSLRFSTLFDISQRSKLLFNANYTENEQTFSEQFGANIVKEASVSFTRQMTRRFYASLGLRYLNRDGDENVNIGGISGIIGPLTDRRISVSIEYKFSKK